MKTKLIVIVLMLMVVSVVARFSARFLGWDRVEAISPDIIVADTGHPTPPTPGIVVVNGARFNFDITVLSVLKGTNNVVHARLQTEHELQPLHIYLVFGFYSDGIYDAYEEYRVIPLGDTYRSEMIAGKPLDEQLQILFKLGVDTVNQEIAEKQAERDRIQAGIIKK